MRGDKKQSKYLSLLLRHRPEKANLTMGKNGWVSVADLLQNVGLTKPELDHIVATNNKKRFEYNGDESRIRARQGHSKVVDVELEVTKPPARLYHGTSRTYMNEILEKGLLKMNRLYVHLSCERETAKNVGRRKGKDLVVLEIDSELMYRDGFEFFLSNNGVWLIKHVPSRYITT